MIECRNIIKEFGTPPQRVLHGIDLVIPPGDFVSISGKSGSGKSTLLYIISTLDTPSQGEVFFEGQNVATWSVEKIHQFRNENIGFIFQFHYLLPELTALENVLLPARNLGLDREKKKDALLLLEELDVAAEARKLPAQMSGGQQQRIAIARALLLKPRYIFADEPTGNLDSANAEIVMKILTRVNQRDGTTISLVTHEPDFAAMAKREIFLSDGRVRPPGS